MIYGIALLLLILGLVIDIPAMRRLAYMFAIKKKSGITMGSVTSRKSAMNTAGWLYLGAVSASEVVNHERPLVTYQTSQGKEMSVEVVPSNFLSRQKYTPGEAVEVAYDLSAPWHAYLVREWKATLREIWISTGIVAIAIVLWMIGYAYNLPW